MSSKNRKSWLEDNSTDNSTKNISLKKGKMSLNWSVDKSIKTDVKDSIELFKKALEILEGLHKDLTK